MLYTSNALWNGYLVAEVLRRVYFSLGMAKYKGNKLLSVHKGSDNRRK